MVGRTSTLTHPLSHWMGEGMGAQISQCLKSFSQTHFVRQNAAEAVLAQKAQPRDALLLVGAQYRFEVPQRWTFQLCFTTLFGGALPPTRGGLHLPVGVLPQRPFQETCLRVADAISLGILLRRAIEQ